MPWTLNCDSTLTFLSRAANRHSVPHLSCVTQPEFGAEFAKACPKTCGKCDQTTIAPATTTSSNLVEGCAYEMNSGCNADKVVLLVIPA